MLASCEAPRPSSSQIEQKATEDNQQRLIAAIPPPQLQTSLERKNLAERLRRINAENMTGYIYLIDHGTVMAFYPVRGKVTSLNAYLSGQEKIVDDPHVAGSLLVESPDFDGAYGKNSDGIFFFTADTNAYVEWFGDYLWSDQPLKLNQEPMMVRQIKSDE
jgi:hypothetical protein